MPLFFPDLTNRVKAQMKLGRWYACSQRHGA